MAGGLLTSINCVGNPQGVYFNIRNNAGVIIGSCVFGELVVVWIAIACRKRCFIVFLFLVFLLASGACSVGFFWAFVNLQFLPSFNFAVFWSLTFKFAMTMFAAQDGSLILQNDFFDIHVIVVLALLCSIARRAAQIHA